MNDRDKLLSKSQSITLSPEIKEALSKMDTIQTELKKLREMRGLTELQASLQSDNELITEILIKNLEAGLKTPTPYTLYKLAELYKADYINLMKLAGYLKPKI